MAGILYLLQDKDVKASFLCLFLIGLSDFCYYLSFFLKCYRVICLSKLTFDALPMINPYIWPFSFFRILATPYFRICKKAFPRINNGKSTFDVSLILALEALTGIIFMLLEFRAYLVIYAAKIAIEANLF
jgi:hypothetical protein